MTMMMMMVLIMIKIIEEFITEYNDNNDEIKKNLYCF